MFFIVLLSNFPMNIKLIGFANDMRNGIFSTNRISIIRICSVLETIFDPGGMGCEMVWMIEPCSSRSCF
jgi:hypothetical protein